jgi:choline dehydrogenase
MPAGIAHLARNRRLNWNYVTEPETRLDGRRMRWPRGKVLGGSSAINAMCYVRGVPADYDGWAAAGADGWTWADVLPYFRRSEGNVRGADMLHGNDGPLAVSELRHVNPLSRAFIEAGVEAGLPRNQDFNGPQQTGVGLYQVTQKDGARCSSATAYLAPVRARPNLEVVTGALVRRIVLENGRACGVAYAHAGRELVARADAEVLLCAGAINSPQLLMLSGIGPAEALRAAGIDVELDQPNVGRHLQDHLDICTLFHTVPGISYDRASELKIAFDYFLRGHRGAGTSNVAEAGGFCARAMQRMRATTSSSTSSRPCSTTTDATVCPVTATRCMPASCTRAAAAASACTMPTRATRRASRRTTCPTRTGST